MPNTREKLMRIMASKPELLINLNISINKLYKLADHLVDNGVTFVADNNVGDKLTPTADKVSPVAYKSSATWIPVTERLPEEDGRYLCNTRSFAFPGSFYQTIMKYEKGGFIEGHIYTDDVTHWMPLPEPPKEG